MTSGAETGTAARATDGVVGAGIAAAAALVLTACALAGRPLLLAGVLLVQLGLLGWWLAVLNAPARSGAALIAAAAAVAADAVVYRPRDAALGLVCAVVGLAFLACLGLQLGRRNRYRVTEALAATMTAVVLVAALAELVALRAARGGREAVVAGLLAVPAALLVGRAVDVARGRPVLVEGVARGWAGLVAGLVAGAAAGAAYGAAARPLSAGSGAFIGLAAAALAAAADLGVAFGSSGMPAGGQRRAVLAVAGLLPLATAAAPTYLLGRLLLG